MSFYDDACLLLCIRITNIIARPIFLPFASNDTRRCLNKTEQHVQNAIFGLPKMIISAYKSKDDQTEEPRSFLTSYLLICKASPSGPR